MLIAADTHVHVYACHDPALTLRTAHDRLAAHGAAVRIVALTERHDCTFFRELRAGRHVAGWAIERCAEPEAVVARDREDRELFILAGRQVVARERVEILALTTDADLADGERAKDVIRSARAAGAIPVLAWAPGKWFFSRGRLVRRLLRDAEPGSLVLGDTSLRPTVWPEPRIMRRAERRGFHVVCGSDPLPFAGEEHQAGRYASLWGAHFDRKNPVAAFRAMVLGAEASPARVGARCDWKEMRERLKRNSAARARA